MSASRLSAVRLRPLGHEPGATVGVVIPCYNYGRFLVQAVESVLTQADVNVDIVIVDDASTDDSLHVARRLASQEPRVRVLANESNAGAVETFNRGLAEVKGEFLVRLDADDMLTPGSLSRSVAVLQHMPSVGLVYGHPIHFADRTPPPARTTARSWTVWAGRDWLASRCAEGTNVITSPEVMMRRTVVDRVGGQSRLAHTHDMEMWLRISAFSDIAYVNGADQAWHREHDGSLSTFAEEPLVILREIADAFSTLFERVGGDLLNVDELSAMSRRAVAKAALEQAQRTIDRGQAVVDVEILMEFAVSCYPALRCEPQWRQAGRRLQQSSGRALLWKRAQGLPRRLSRRVRDRVRYVRWSRTGQYLPMRFTVSGRAAITPDSRRVQT